jgi:hypothetical protein
MKNQVLRRTAVAAVATLAWSWCLASQAAEWPSEAAARDRAFGGRRQLDIVTRLLGNALSKRLGQAVTTTARVPPATSACRP